MTEDEMVGGHHRLNGHGFGWTLGVGAGQGGLACCSSWGHKDLDTTERLNCTELTDLHRLLRPKVIAIAPGIVLLSKDLMGIYIWLVCLAEVLGPSQRSVNTMASLPLVKRCMAYLLSPLFPLSLLLELVVPN